MFGRFFFSSDRKNNFNVINNNILFCRVDMTSFKDRHARRKKKNISKYVISIH